MQGYANGEDGLVEKGGVHFTPPSHSFQYHNILLYPSHFEIMVVYEQKAGPIGFMIIQKSMKNCRIYSVLKL